MRAGPSSPAGTFPLGTVEAWMQEVIVHPGGAEEGVRSARAAALVPPEMAGGVVLETGGLSAADRLEIYAGMYPLRMRDALESDYPVVARLLGPRAFGDLVRDFVAAHPSTSFTLARLGDPLPEFLRGWGPKRRRTLVADVARLELAATQVFDAFDPGEPPVGASGLAEVPPADLSRLTFRPVPALRVVRVRAGALAALDASLEGSRLPRRPGRGTAVVVFHRKGGEVLRRSVDPFAGRLLELLTSGESLGEALARTSRERRGRARPEPSVVSDWFREWVDLGFFLESTRDAPPAPPRALRPEGNPRSERRFPVF